MQTLTNKSTLKNTKDNRLSIRFPPNTDLMHKHIPIPLLKSAVIEFNKKYAEYIHWIRTTRTAKFRKKHICEQNRLRKYCQQIHNPIAKYMYSKKKAVLRNYNYQYLFVKAIEYPRIQITEESELFYYRLNEITYRKPFFYSISDHTQSFRKKKNILKKLNVFFNNYYPKKADFEK
jgi:hypothetical protein